MPRDMQLSSYSLPTSQASPTTAFGSLHAAFLNLASRCICNSRWIKFVTPQTETEGVWAGVHGEGVYSALSPT